MTTRQDDEEDERLLAAGDIGGAMARYYQALLARARTRLGDERAQAVVRATVTRVYRDWRRHGGFGHPIRVILHARLGQQIADQGGGRAPGTALLSGSDRPEEESVHAHVDVGDDLEEVLSRLTPADRRVAEGLYFEGCRSRRSPSTTDSPRGK